VCTAHHFLILNSQFQILFVISTEALILAFARKHEGEVEKSIEKAIAQRFLNFAF